MAMKINCFFLVLIGILSSNMVHAGPANENEQIVNQAFSAIDNNYKSSWAYTRTSTKDDEPSKVGYFDPRLTPDAQWTLISIGDRKPTSKEQDAWALRRMQGDEDKKNGMGAMVTPGTVQLLQESETHWIFSFAPAPDERDDKETRKVLSEVTGKLRVNKKGLYAEEISLSNANPFSPATGVKIKHFEMRMTYGPISDGGPVVPQSVDSRIQGRAFMVVSIDDIKKIHFSDYQKVVTSGSESSSVNQRSVNNSRERVKR
jgi:hypothetical protein